MSDDKNNNEKNSEKDIETGVRSLEGAMQNLKSAFGEFKESNKDLMIKTGSVGSVNPEDLSEEDLSKLADSLKDLEKRLKNINI